MKKKCYLCNKITKQVITNREIRGKVKCKVFKCISCELQYLDAKFVKNFLTDRFYKKDYVKLYDKSFFKNKNNHYIKIYEKIKKYVKNKNVLEIGAGGGYLYHYLKKSVKSYEAVELSKKQRNYLIKKFKIKAHPTVELVNKKYDIVIIVSVLEHVIDPINFLQNLKSLLKKRGKIIIECPSINDPLVKFYDVEEYRNFYYRPVHLNYFNKSHLIKIVKKSKLKLIKTFSILVYSLTNHIQWLYTKKRSEGSTDATNVYLPIRKSPKPLLKIFDKLNKLYFKELQKNKSADLEVIICEKN